MKGTEYLTKEAVLKKGREAIGIPLKDIDKKGRLATGKGAVGTVIEESWFGYTPNSESEPDFPEAGVELKVTPYVRGEVAYVPKSAWYVISSIIWKSMIRLFRPVHFGTSVTLCF